MPLALTPANIQAGFQKTGIYPFNRDIFQEIDFAPSFVTDRPNPNSPENVIAPSAPDVEIPPLLPSLLNEASTSAGHLAEPEIEASKQNAEIHISQTFDELATKTPPRVGNNDAYQESSALATNCVPPSHVTLTKPSNVNVQQSTPKPSTSTQFVFSPEEVRSYPKAPPRKTARGRRTKRSAIYTDTPEKEAIRKEYEERQKRLKDKQVKKKVLQPNTEKKNKGKEKRKKNKADTPLVSSEDEDFYCLVCLEAYSDSRSGEKWVQCQGTCRLWSHLECTDGGRYYICQNCNESD